MDLIFRHFVNRDQVPARFCICVHHLFQTSWRAFNDDIRQQDSKRVPPDNVTCAPDRMAETARGLLAHKTHRAFFGAQAFHLGGEVRFAAHFEIMLQLIGIVEIVFDRVFVSAGDENDMFDARFQRFIHDILQGGPVHDR